MRRDVGLSVALGVIVLFMGAGCSRGVDALKPSRSECSKSVQDLCDIPQDAAVYALNVKEEDKLLPSQQSYMQDYYKPWRYVSVPESLESITWPFETYKAEGGYGVNLRPLEKVWFDEMSSRSNFKRYGSLNRFALSLHFTNLRNFPTDKPYFNDPLKAGEGFPFDYLQNSAVHANEPLFVSHISKDGAWSYVFSSYATGWIKSNEIVYLGLPETQEWQNHRHIYLTNDSFAVKDESGRFLFRGRIGNVLPMLKEEDDSYVVLAAVADRHGKAVFVKARIPKGFALKKPLLFNRKNIALIGNGLLRSKYGWGGLYEERDCSSTLRDFFATFGIWLPRNSSQQAKVGKVISLDGFDNHQKIEVIRRRGRPFRTLFYLKGHIVLYAGMYMGKVIVLQNIWGIKTVNDGVEGRRIIGGVVFSTLEIGKEIDGYDKEHSLLSRLVSMNIVTEKTKIHDPQP